LQVKKSLDDHASSRAQLIATTWLLSPLNLCIVIFANKLVLTSYGFPSFNMLAASQFLATSLIMLLLHVLGRIQVSDHTTARPLTATLFSNKISHVRFIFL
jgi:hypothetical protein